MRKKTSFKNLKRKAIFTGIILTTMSITANQGYCLLGQTHDYVAHAFLDNPLVAQVHGLSDDAKKHRYEAASKLDYQSKSTRDKFHHVTGVFEERKYATDQNWRDLSRDDRLIYLLHDMGDACMALGHFGTYNPQKNGKKDGSPELWIEGRICNRVDKYSDITHYTNAFWNNYSLSMTRSEAWAQYKVDQQNVNDWIRDNVNPLWTGYKNTSILRVLKRNWYKNAVQDKGEEAFFGCSAGSMLNNGYIMSVYHLLDFFLLERPIEGSIKAETTEGENMKLSFEGYDPDSFMIKSYQDGDKYKQELDYTNGAGITQIEWDLDADGVFETVVTKPQDSVIDTSVYVNSMSLFGNYMRNGATVPVASCRVTDDDNHYAGNGVDQTTKVFNYYIDQ